MKSLLCWQKRFLIVLLNEEKCKGRIILGCLDVCIYGYNIFFSKGEKITFISILIAIPFWLLGGFFIAMTTRYFSNLKKKN